MWERFSYFGNCALVVLYMVKHLLQPSEVEAVLGLGAVKGALEALFGPLDMQPFASQLFGFYTGLAYFTPILGGLLADRVLGQRRTVIIGGVLMAIGHFMMAFEALFLVALLMLILGIGTFKPNISTLVCALVSMFWATYDQQFNTILLWIEDFTERSVDLGFWQGEIPTPWFLALNPLMIFVFTPLIVRLWAWQAGRGTEPLTVSKMAFGCLCVALANLVMVAAAGSGSGAKVSALWLVGYFVLVTIGELYLAPVGLALISRVAPARIRSMMMGFWFATTLPGDIFGGWLGGFWSTMDKAQFYLMIASIAALAGTAIWAVSSSLKSIFGE